MPTPKVIPLLELEQELTQAQMPGGRVVPVRQADGFVYDFRSQAMQGSVEDATQLWAAAHRCLPTATDDEVKGLTRTQAWGVIAIACGGADEVMAEIARRREAEASAGDAPDTAGNGAAPAAATEPPAADSDPSTPSGTS